MAQDGQESESLDNEYIIFVSEKKIDQFSRPYGMDVAVRIVREEKCSEFEYEHAITVAAIRSKYKVYRVHGRRRGQDVEVFFDLARKEYQLMLREFEERAYNITEREYPSTIWEERHLLIQDAFASKILPHRKDDIAYGILGGMLPKGRLLVLPTARSTYEAIRDCCKHDDELPTVLDGFARVLGTIRMNYVSLFATDEMLDAYFKNERHVEIQLVSEEGDEATVDPDEEAARLERLAARKAKERAKKQQYQTRRKAEKRAEKAAEAKGLESDALDTDVDYEDVDSDDDAGSDCELVDADFALSQHRRSM